MTVANNMVVIYGPQSKYGADIPLSVVGIVMKVFGIAIAFIVGIAVGGQPIIGYNYGAKNHRRVFATLRRIIAVNAIVGLIAMLLVEFCPQAIVLIFGSENDLYNEFAYLCFRIFLGGILLCCMQKTGSVFLQAIGKPVQSTLLSLSRDVIFLVPAVIIMSVNFGVTGMLWAAPIADILAFIFTVILIGREIKTMKLLEEGNAEFIKSRFLIENRPLRLP
jgi:Na+-driven multidrug efflux pump